MVTRDQSAKIRQSNINVKTFISEIIKKSNKVYGLSQINMSRFYSVLYVLKL